MPFFILYLISHGIKLWESVCEASRPNDDKKDGTDVRGLYSSLNREKPPLKKSQELQMLSKSLFIQGSLCIKVALDLEHFFEHSKKPSKE